MTFMPFVLIFSILTFSFIYNIELPFFIENNNAHSTLLKTITIGLFSIILYIEIFMIYSGFYFLIKYLTIKNVNFHFNDYKSYEEAINDKKMTAQKLIKQIKKG